MKRILMVLLIVAALLVTTAAVMARPGEQMELVCWQTPNQGEQSAYFMKTGSGIVHRFKIDGKHDIYKKVDDFPML